ncbi:MAG: DoxX family protein [Alphaproteobacteria bacterium]|nr:DoxX family protein [Alphaproteobacteria bacterium]
MKAITWPALDGWRDHGLLLLRVGLGGMFLFHGWPKVTGGPELWAKIGASMSGFGITFGYTAWGFLAAVTEAFGGVLLALGLATRPVALALWFTMVVAAKMHLDNGDGVMGASHAIEDGVAFLAIVLLGPGRFSVDRRLKG